jgi:hypothetical protein
MNHYVGNRLILFVLALCFVGYSSVTGAIQNEDAVPSSRLNFSQKNDARAAGEKILKKMDDSIHLVQGAVVKRSFRAIDVVTKSVGNPRVIVDFDTSFRNSVGTFSERVSLEFQSATNSWQYVAYSVRSPKHASVKCITDPGDGDGDDAVRVPVTKHG